MKTTAAIFGLIISLTVVGAAQVRTVTNATLERFQQKRLAAEREYRDNYERMGFPSPEELDRQREVDMTARLELAAQLRKSRLEEERIDLERQKLALESARLDAEIEERDSEDGIFYGGGYFGGGFSGIGGFGFGNGFGKFRPFGGFNNFRRFPRNPQVIRITPFGVQAPRARATRAFRGGKRR